MQPIVTEHPTAPEYPIVTEQLTRRFGDFTAVDQASLRVEPRTIFGFLGPNGSGKTTVIKMLCGLLPPSGGRAWVDGLDVEQDSEEVRNRIGYMSQRFSLYDDLTVEENLEFYARIYGLKNSELSSRIEAMVGSQQLGLYRHRLAGKLSGGWKQRLALGCALIHRPKILFLDEPTAGIDPVARRALWDQLFDLCGQGMTLFVTTHYMDEAERCGHIAYIYYGKIIADGTPGELKTLPNVTPEGTYRVEISAPEVARALRVSRAISPIRRATVFGQAIHALVDAACGLDQLEEEFRRAGAEVHDLRTIAPSLEDVFVELTSQLQESEVTADA